MNSHDILTTLKIEGKPLTRAELASIHSRSKSSIVSLVSPLVKAGLVQRSETRDDRRRRVYTYSLPQPDNPLQIRHLRTGGYSARCPDCGKRKRLIHLRNFYLLACTTCGLRRFYEMDELLAK